jgi:hypothetical protein
MKRFKDFDIKQGDSFTGDKIKIDKILNREIAVLKYKLEDSKYPKNKSGKCLHLQIEMSGTKYIVFSGSDYLMGQLKQVGESDFPFSTAIVKSNDHFEFT